MRNLKTVNVGSSYMGPACLADWRKQTDRAWHMELLAGWRSQEIYFPQAAFFKVPVQGPPASACAEREAC